MAGLRRFENVIELPIGQFVDARFHRHPDLKIAFGNVVCNAAEDLVVAVIEQRNAVGQIVFESHRPELKTAVGDQFTAAFDCEPFDGAGQAVAAVGPGREKNQTAVGAAGAHHLSLLQVPDEVVDL